MAWPTKVATNAPTMPRMVVRMKPDGLFGPGESKRATMRAVRAQELLRGGGHGGKAALHIGGAASVEHPAADGGREGGRAPFLERSGGNHVCVPGEAKDGLMMRIAFVLSQTDPAAAAQLVTEQIAPGRLAVTRVKLRPEIEWAGAAPEKEAEE